MTRELLDKANKLDSDNGINLDKRWLIPCINLVLIILMSIEEQTGIYQVSSLIKMKNVFEEHLKQQRENKIKTSENKKYIRNCWI